MGTLALLVRLMDPSGNSSHRVSSQWGRWICEWNGIRVEVQGLEDLSRDQPQIFVANHQSYFDIFALSGYIPLQIRWVAKASLFRIPFVGWAMWASRYIPVVRKNRGKAYQAFITTIGHIKSGASIVIFPEGTRSKNGMIGEFKKGGHLLATRSGAPMVPVTIIGTGSIIRKGSFLVRPGRVKVIISSPITVSPAEKDTVLDRIRNIIYKCYTENSSNPEN